ncbi:YciI family protein [Hahella ganghwensis]|uniref:YciI family protein n=1 Tax=Hahella ganghwensis TaxID=286420 RepID=UPI0003756AA2|nr:YciI family protein [Hahella ganghwensis]
MQYMLLIHHDSAWPDSSVDMEPLFEQHRKLQKLSKSKGHFVAGDRLHGIETATTVRRRNDELVVTDGPFAESKEVFVGYYLMDCENLDQALEYARMIPVPEGGGVEVRPVNYSVPRG